MEIDDPIFVAGHNGMVGSAIVRNLLSNGYKEIITVSRNQLDLCDNQKVQQFFGEYKPKYVFLAAAKVGGILANFEQQADFIVQNLKIQTNVIDACKNFGVEKVLFLGSSCIYPKNCSQPIKEEYLLSGQLEETNEAYAIAKIAGLKICEAYNKQYGLETVSLMPTNLYGPNDNFNLHTSHVFAALIRKFDDAKNSNAANVCLWGDGTPRREFLHVDDLARACNHFMHASVDPKPINIGTGIDITIKNLARLIAKEIGYQGDITWDKTKPNGTMRKVLDTGRASQLGWEPKIHLEEGIRNTLSWYYENIEVIKR